MRVALRRNAVDVALFGGFTAIAAGVALIFLPAGLIVGGLLAAGSALVLGRES